MKVEQADYPGLLVEREGPVFIVTLNRPERLNALDWPTHGALERLLYDVGTESEIRSIVITGSGRAFSAGGDATLMSDMQSGKIDEEAMVRGGARLLRNLLAIPQPVVAAVNGHAIGLGATIAFHCDVVFASDQATFSDPHVQMGLVAGDGGAVIWPLVIGPTRAKRYLMTGDPMTAEDAFDMGLVTHLVKPDGVLEEAKAFAKRLAQGPRAAIEGTKAAVNKYVRQWAEQVLSESLDLERLSMHHPDHKRRVDEFLEKRFERF